MKSLLKIILLVLLSMAAQGNAAITSPVSGATLDGSSQTFTWNADYLTGVMEYWLRVGSTPGAGNFFDRSTGTSLSQTVNGLPTDGSTVYVRMWARVSSGWVFGDFQSYATPVLAESRAVMTSPAPGSSTTGSSQTFSWNAGSGGLEYWLQVGNAPGGTGFFNGTIGSNLSKSVSGLPTDRSTVYVRLWTRFSSGWDYSDYTYTTPFAGKYKAAMASPVFALTGSSQTFTWNEGTGGLEYWLQVGNAPGGTGYFDRSAGASLSQAVSGLPTNGSTVYVRLWTKFSSGWDYNDYIYATSMMSQTQAAMTSPVSGATLTGSSQTFTWNAGSAALEYWLDIGNSTGGTGIFSGTAGISLSKVVSGLPTNGNPVCVRLWTKFSSGWVYNDYTYATSAGSQTKAAMTSPVSGSTLGDSSQTFTWNAGSAALEYWLQAGSSPGGNNYFNQSVGTSVSRTISGLPGNGSPVYVRLWTRFANGWGTTTNNFTDYTYTAATITTAGGATLTIGGATVTGGSGWGTLTLANSGTLTLATTLTAGGTLTLRAGTTITLSRGGALITSGGETLTLGAGATLANSGGTPLTLSVAGSTFTSGGGGTLTVGGGTTFTLGGTDTLLTGTGLISVTNVQSGGTLN